MYLIYKLTSPSGRFYIGITMQSLAQRWYNHVRRAVRGENKNHPLYNSIRKYGAENFTTEVLAAFEDETEALQAEVRFITESGANTVGYNVSKGGEYDWATGVDHFAKLRQDPSYEASYRAKLKAGIAASEKHRNHAKEFGQVSLKWRAENPREAYRLSYRAHRITQRAMGVPRGEKRDYRFSKECGRLAMPGSKKVTVARSTFGISERIKKQWAVRSAAEREQVGRQISEATKAHHAAKSPEKRAVHNAQLAKARKNIDQDLRKRRQKEAILTYWTPERRAAKTAALKALWTPERRLAQSKATRTEKSRRPPLTF